MNALMNPDWMAAMSRTAKEIVKYTPEHFKRIECELRCREGEAGRELVCKIVCPDFPDEWTDKPGHDLHAAACDLVRCFESRGSAFPGVKIHIDVQQDGRWRNSFELMSLAAAVQAEPGRTASEASTLGRDAETDLRWQWSQSNPPTGSHTLFVLKTDSEHLQAALTEFWRGILTEGLRFAAGHPWEEIHFWVTSSNLQASFNDHRHRRIVPVLFELHCPAFADEYNSLPTEDGDVTNEAADQYSRRHYGDLVRAASLAPVSALLNDVQTRRPFPIVGMFYEGWEQLAVK